MSDLFECPVLQDSCLFSETYNLECNHRFAKAVLRDIILHDGCVKTCPLCRRYITPHDEKNILPLWKRITRRFKRMLPTREMTEDFLLYLLLMYLCLIYTIIILCVVIPHPNRRSRDSRKGGRRRKGKRTSTPREDMPLPLWLRFQLMDYHTNFDLFTIQIFFRFAYDVYQLS